MTKQKQTWETLFKGNIDSKELIESLTNGDFYHLKRRKHMPKFLYIILIIVALLLMLFGATTLFAKEDCGHYEQECIAWSESCADTETYCTRWCCDKCCNWQTDCISWTQPVCTEYDQVWVEEECEQPNPPDEPKNEVTQSLVGRLIGGGGCWVCLLPQINRVEVNQCKISILTSQFMKSKVVCDTESHQFPLILGKPLINPYDYYDKVLLDDGDNYWTYFTFTFPDSFGDNFYCRAVSATPLGLESWSQEFLIDDCESESAFGSGGLSSPPPPEPQIDWLTYHLK